MKIFKLRSNSEFGKMLVAMLLVNKTSQRSVEKLHSDFHNVIGFEGYDVKTLLVDRFRYQEVYDFSYGIWKDEYDVLAVAGHMHNPDTATDAGYFFFSALLLGVIPYHMTIPDLPYGFTAVSCAKANSLYDNNGELDHQKLTAFLTAVDKNGRL